MVIQIKNDKKDTYSYNGWMNSDSFIKRCFGVIGHNLMGMLMFYIGAGVLVAGLYILADVFAYILG